MKCKRVQVYRNLHTGTWSVRQGGIVIDHPLELMLRDCRFVVQPAGRARVLREKRKNVHAYVSGYVVDSSCAKEFLYDVCEARYNPYRASYFTGSDPEGWALTRSCYAAFRPKKIFAYQPLYENPESSEEPMLPTYSNDHVSDILGFTNPSHETEARRHKYSIPSYATVT